MAKKKNEIQIFKVSGKYVKYHQKFAFTKYVRAMNEDYALDKILSEITSQKILRRKIDITEITPISLDECPDQYIHQLSNMS